MRTGYILIVMMLQFQLFGGRFFKIEQLRTDVPRIFRLYARSVASNGSTGEGPTKRRVVEVGRRVSVTSGGVGKVVDKFPGGWRAVLLENCGTVRILL